MRRSVMFFLVLISFSASAQTLLSASSQSLPKSSFTKLRKMEDSMKTYARQMIMDESAGKRFSADSVFTRMLVRSLVTPNSFYYPFDSLITVSHIYAPDSSFRIFSWQYTKDEDHYRQRGAIQMKTENGSLLLHPLFDMSDFTPAPQDSVRTSQNWIGSIYYGVIMKTHNNKKYYTLLGFDDNNMRSTKKWIEVLTFNEQGKPVFGGPYFSIRDTTNKVKETYLTPARFCLEYKKNGGARVNYDPDMDMIIFDHLLSENNLRDKAYDMVPDGDFQGFKWDKGHWAFVDKVFDFKLKDGEAPMPEPLKDDNGKNDEEKLLRQSEKNGFKITPDPKSSAPKKSSKKG